MFQCRCPKWFRLGDILNNVNPIDFRILLFVVKYRLLPEKF